MHDGNDNLDKRFLFRTIQFPFFFKKGTTYKAYLFDILNTAYSQQSHIEANHNKNQTRLEICFHSFIISLIRNATHFTNLPGTTSKNPDPTHFHH